MASGEYSEELCEELHAIPKYISSQISWKAKTNRGNALVFRAKALAEDGRGLDLIGYWQKIGRHGIATWGFSLRYMGFNIRSYDMAQKHRNPGGHGSIKGPHKHKYRSSKIDRFAYKPNPPISEDNPNKALLDFLKESNITLKVAYHHHIFA